MLRPRDEGGLLHHAGQVEVISSLERDGRPVFRDLRWGVYVTFRAGDATARTTCAAASANTASPPIRRAATPRCTSRITRSGSSSASASRRSACGGEPTGQAIGWHGDVVATAKRDLAAGETLDGEGGYTVYGKLMPARRFAALGGLPLGLAHGVKLERPIAAHAPVRWEDVATPATDAALEFRREMEANGASASNRRASGMPYRRRTGRRQTP